MPGTQQKWSSVIDVSGDESKIQCCKEQYCIRTWNARSMNQGKLKMIKQQMARGNNSILVISKLKWTGMSNFNSDGHCIYYCRQESLRRNGVALIVNKRVWNAVLGCSLKNDRMICVCFQGKPFSITVFQVCAPATNAKENEVDWFYENLQELLELTLKKRCPFHCRPLECKRRKSGDTWSNRQVWPWSTKWSSEKSNNNSFIKRIHCS